MVKKEKVAITTKVISCTCKHAFQDKEYGKGNRLMNVCAKGFRCTVCGEEHSV